MDHNIRQTTKANAQLGNRRAPGFDSYGFVSVSSSKFLPALVLSNRGKRSALCIYYYRVLQRSQWDISLVRSLYQSGPV